MTQGIRRTMDSVIVMLGISHHNVMNFHIEILWKLFGYFVEKYYLIIPAMDGFYKDSGEFTSFEDQSRQIEEYVIKNHDGKLYGFYGVSQGGLMGCELLARNNINVEKAFLDGTYIAHQGRIAGVLSAKTFINAKHRGGKLPKAN